MRFDYQLIAGNELITNLRSCRRSRRQDCSGPARNDVPRAAFEWTHRPRSHLRQTAETFYQDCCGRYGEDGDEPLRFGQSADHLSDEGHLIDLSSARPPAVLSPNDPIYSPRISRIGANFRTKRRPSGLALTRRAIVSFANIRFIRGRLNQPESEETVP